MDKSKMNIQKNKKASVEKIQINDLIFRELIKRGYSLVGNTRIWNIADSKLWYLTPEQAQGFLDLEKSEDYQKMIIKNEMNLINENVDEILEKVGTGPVNIIDLGCGDGKKAVIFVQHLKGKVKLRYCPVDISSYMVDKALERISKMNVGEVIKFQWNISDFENVENIAFLLRREDFKKNLFLLLGNTLGNFEIHELLYEIRNAMKEGDILLIGNGLDNKHHEDLLKSYFTDEVNNWLVNIPLKLGLKKDEVEFGARVRDFRVELYYSLKKDKEIQFQNKRVSFLKGDQIVVAVSYKYDKHDFMTYSKMYFSVVDMFVSDDESYALVMCKK